MSAVQTISTLFSLAMHYSKFYLPLSRYEDNVSYWQGDRIVGFQFLLGKTDFFFSPSERPHRLQDLPASPSILLSWYSFWDKAAGSWSWSVTSSETNNGCSCISSSPNALMMRFVLLERRNNWTLPSVVSFFKNQKRGNEEMGVLPGPVRLFGLITVLRFLGNCRGFMWRPINHSTHHFYIYILLLAFKS